MSLEDVEIVRGFYEAFARGDLESALGVLDPAVGDWRWEPEGFLEAGDCVVAILRVYATGRESGINLERLDGAVWTIRSGKCVRLDSPTRSKRYATSTTASPFASKLQ